MGREARPGDAHELVGEEESELHPLIDSGLADKRADPSASRAVDDLAGGCDLDLDDDVRVSRRKQPSVSAGR
jgi:hypothetical protein